MDEFDEKEWNSNFAFLMGNLGAVRPTAEPKKWEMLLVLLEQKYRAREALTLQLVVNELIEYKNKFPDAEVGEAISYIVGIQNRPK